MKSDWEKILMNDGNLKSEEKSIRKLHSFVPITVL